MGKKMDQCFVTTEPTSLVYKTPASKIGLPINPVNDHWHSIPLQGNIVYEKQQSHVGFIL